MALREQELGKGCPKGSSTASDQINPLLWSRGKMERGGVSTSSGVLFALVTLQVLFPPVTLLSADTDIHACRCVVKHNHIKIRIYGQPKV